LWIARTTPAAITGTFSVLSAGVIKAFTVPYSKSQGEDRRNRRRNDRRSEAKQLLLLTGIALALHPGKRACRYTRLRLWLMSSPTV